MILIDTHLHLLKSDYNDIKSVIERAYKKDIKYLILGGNSLKDNLENISLSNSYSNIFITLGYHPDEALNISLSDLEILEKQIIKNKDKVVGIGEIGLDYHFSKENKEQQQWLFIKQLKIANKYNLPVVIHTRDAVFDTINILKKFKLRGVIHCFSGSLEIAKEYIKLGYKLGIGGVLTFSNSNLKLIMEKIGINNIVLETDSPYLSPIRGEKNEPQNIKLIAQFLSDQINISLEEVANITTRNAISLFDLKDII